MSPIPRHPQLLPRLLRPPRRYLIGLVPLAPATVPHREPLLREVALRWPRDPSRDDELLAQSLRQRGGEAFTKPCAVKLEARLVFPVEHSTSRVRGYAVRAEMARLFGEGMRRREVMKASLTHCCSDGSDRGVTGG